VVRAGAMGTHTATALHHHTALAIISCRAIVRTVVRLFPNKNSFRKRVSIPILQYRHIALKKRVNWFPYVTYDLCTLSIYITSM
jgi:hypothetical protein